MPSYGDLYSCGQRAPQTYSPTTLLLLVHHGDLRNGGDFRDFWLPLVDENQLLVIAPEFSATTSPGPEWYNLGNLSKQMGARSPARNGPTAFPAEFSRPSADKGSRRDDAMACSDTRLVGSSCIA
jgi:hypothetical protein